MPIDEENRRAGDWLSIDDAVREDLCFVVELAEDIVALDIDSAEFTEATLRLASALTDHGLKPVRLASGRAGHEHLIVKVSARPCRQWVAEEARLLRLRPTRSLRPPLTRHRHGLSVLLIDPSEPAEALQYLRESPIPCAHPTPQDRSRSSGDRRRGLPDGRSSPRPQPDPVHALDELLGPPITRANRVSLVTPPWPLPLPAWAHELLVHGPVTDRSQGLLDVARAAITRNWSLHDFIRALEDPTHVLGEKYREHSNPYLVASSAWQAAEGFLASISDHPEPSVDLLAFGAAAASTPMAGIAGLYLRRLLLGVFDIALKSGRTTNIPLSERSIALASGLSRGTVRKYLSLARTRGWLVPETDQRGGLAARFTLCVPTDADPTPLVLLGGVSGSRWLCPGDDVFLRGALRPSSFEVLMLLGDLPLRICDLAASTGRHPETVRKALRQLREAGFAESSASGWVRSDAKPAEVAARFGTDSKAELRRIRVRIEREEYRRIQEALFRKPESRIADR